jgi:hypothetical protein
MELTWIRKTSQCFLTSRNNMSHMRRKYDLVLDWLFSETKLIESYFLLLFPPIVLFRFESKIKSRYGSAPAVRVLETILPAFIISQRITWRQTVIDTRQPRKIKTNIPRETSEIALKSFYSIDRFVYVDIQTMKHIMIISFDILTD